MPAPLFALTNDDLGVIIGATLAVMVFGTLLLGLVFVIRDTIRGKGRWGINLKQTFCKECGEPAPAIRKPASLSQALWGGWTCEECGLELDKWGEPLPDQPQRRSRKAGSQGKRNRNRGDDDD
jgi:hypothetical protein